MANKLNSAARCRINLHRSIDFIYPNNQPMKKEIMGKHPLTVASKKIKYLGISLIMGVIGQYSGNNFSRFFVVVENKCFHTI